MEDARKQDETLQAARQRKDLAKSMVLPPKLGSYVITSLGNLSETPRVATVATCINLPTETYQKNPKNATLHAFVFRFRRFRVSLSPVSTLGGHIAKSPRAQGVALMRLL